MEKFKTKCRRIKFMSQKNEAVVCVYTQSAKKYAKYLEDDSEVIRYETLKELDPDRYAYINPVDIRKEYFESNWISDFVLHYDNGQISIREIVKKNSLFKRSTIEKLEFSRRYWMGLNIRDWKIVIVEGDD
jgi:hypothetical protein